jgi:hypothetical protein
MSLGLMKDYEELTEMAKVFVNLATIGLMLCRLARYPFSDTL